MKEKYITTQFINEYHLLEDADGRYIENRKKYECTNLDDLQNLLLTLIECSMGPIKFQVEKVEVEDDE